VAVGREAAQISQGNYAIAVGHLAGETTQGGSAVAVGREAGRFNQGGSATAVGYAAGLTSQGSSAVAVGYFAGQTSQGTNAVAVGREAGRTSQGDFAVAVGREAGQTSQGDFAVAVGYVAGLTSQGGAAVAIALQAGKSNQGNASVAVGLRAGEFNQAAESVAIGKDAGNTSQGTNATAVGVQAGKTSQGSLSVAVGYRAGQTNQHANSIVLNASGTALNTAQASSFYVKPVRGGNFEASALAYTSAGEIVEETGMNFDASGNVGIGAASPGAKLDVVTSSTTPALWLRNSTTSSGCVINMTDINTSDQFGTLTYWHTNTASLGAANRLHFSTSESSSVFSTEGTLMIGVDGKDNGQMLSNGNAGRKNLWIQSTYGGNTSQNYGWWIGAQNQTLSSTDNDMYFAVVRAGSISLAGTINDQFNGAMNNFTGQHRSFVKGVPTQQLEDKEGLIVSADQNEFIRMSGGIARGNEAITTNESLPVVSFSTKSNDKKCFGVVSTTEDPENRVEVYGNFKSNMHKELGDTRVYINSVGEGAIWVTNINGSLESGDYITTSNVAGYGMRQEDDILHNYTVAKITMDCDFNPRTQPKKIIKKELANVDYWIDYATSEIKQEEYETLPENEREIREDKYYKIYKREIQKTNPENDKFVHEVHEELVNVLDEHGQLQWEDDPSGATEKAYKIRYLDANGNITDEANHVYKAAFVGCTYHCG
jgi:hypothetical protein